MDKLPVPDESMLRAALGDTFSQWSNLRSFVLEVYPEASEEWNFPGAKYGWSFRIKDKKRAILYLLPRNGFFKTAFVFGQKATDTILSANIDDSIKHELLTARVYAEGRGIRIDVHDSGLLEDLKFLIRVKLAN